MRVRCCLALAIVSLATLMTSADEKLKDRACRSVHLQYPGPESVAFYNEVTVAESSPGTYFCACGFGKGYFGIQELASGKKLVIFSVWDPGNQNDPRSVAADRRVKVLHQGKGVRIGRFGGEGTGGQSFFDHDWKVGQTYRFLVTAAPDGADRTAYAAHFYLSDKKTWHHLATFSTMSGGKHLSGYYSFVEDFLRNRVSATKVRRASYGNGWARAQAGKWVALTTARFTADSNPATNIDAGLDGRRFFLATGGKTENRTTKLRNVLTLEEQAPPDDLPAHPSRAVKDEPPG